MGRRINGCAIVPSALGVRCSRRIKRKNIGFIFMRVPEVSWIAPFPGGILGKDVVGNEALVLDDKWDPDEIRQEPLADKTDLEIVNDDVSGRDPCVGIEPGATFIRTSPNTFGLKEM